MKKFLEYINEQEIYGPINPDEIELPEMNSIQDWATWLVKRDITDQLRKNIKKDSTWQDALKIMNEEWKIF